MPAAVRKTLNDSLARMEDALFDYDKSTIRTDATSALKDDANIIRGILSDYPSQKLIIQGNTDERGSDEYNMALGDRRARAAQEFLVTMGVSAGQLEVISFGKRPSGLHRPDRGVLAEEPPRPCDCLHTVSLLP